MPVQVVRDRMKAIEKSGLDNIRIGWWGESERNQRHHYVVQDEIVYHRVQQYSE